MNTRADCSLRSHEATRHPVRHLGNGPWVKTGGLGDVAAALPAALHRAGHDIRVLLPALSGTEKAFPTAPAVAEIPRWHPACRLAACSPREDGGLPFCCSTARRLFDRPAILPRCQRRGLDRQCHPFLACCRCVAALTQPGCHRRSPGRPTSFIATIGRPPSPRLAALREAARPASSPVSGIAFQGCFGRDMLGVLGLPEHAWRFDHVECRQPSFLKADLQLASQPSTVSPTYAREIQERHFGYGLAPLLRHRAGDLRGILNGVDTGIWNLPPIARWLPGYAAQPPSALTRRRCKAEMGLKITADRPLFGVISRLTHQKGLDLLLTVGEGCAHCRAQLVGAG